MAQRVAPTPSPHFRTVIGVFPEQDQFALVRLGETPQLFLSVKGDSFRPCPVLNRLALSPKRCACSPPGQSTRRGLHTEWSSRNDTGTADKICMNATRGHQREPARQGNVCVSCGDSYSFVVPEVPDRCGPCALLVQVFAGTLFKPKSGAKLLEPIRWTDD